jgi:AP-1 complex subunit beta-1
MCGFPQAAKDVVLAEKPVISDDSNQLDSSLLDELLANISTLSSVYHKPPEAFISRVKAAPRADDEEFADAGEAGYSESPSQGVDGASPSSSTGTSSNVPV